MQYADIFLCSPVLVSAQTYSKYLCVDIKQLIFETDYIKNGLLFTAHYCRITKKHHPAEFSRLLLLVVPDCTAGNIIMPAHTLEPEMMPHLPVFFRLSVLDD